MTSAWLDSPAWRTTPPPSSGSTTDQLDGATTNPRRYHTLEAHPAWPFKGCDDRLPINPPEPDLRTGIHLGTVHADARRL